MLEIIGMTVEDAKMIEDCGADRIELVSALTEGGLTPSFGLIEKVVNSVKIPVNVMIRHHANSFVYSEEDINIMLKDIEIVNSIGANGIVLGLLDDKDKIDKVNLNRLIENTNSLDITFHKAIDETNPVESIKLLNSYSKITNVLTSGGKGDIINNLDTINKMINESKNIKVLLGGGLNFDNIEKVKESICCCDYHFGTAVRTDKDPFKKIDEKKLKKLVSILNS
ncbi:copper homeostasis protein CutC [Romboutsia lituseburensis]|uniref:copper homeostasis protein CutC n=1 Tax=Romboutsia lituseburensis TaxID=1537 RepID=UPI00215AC826|nr:copper homeostasis protein CutC [Romboutsia lituseburensis]MCR8746379.1 copper homeostasis protein CutC [Romboutsia lituseburensis]